MTALADRVKESTTTTGTGSLTLSGAVAQFESFNTAFGTAAPFYYVITDANGTDWEVGTGELSNATTLVRTTVHQSSNADAKINLSAGTHTVFCSAPAVFLADLASKSGKLSQFAATTSAELAGVISDETGSGALVFATSPTLTTPNIGVATATSVNGTTIPSSKTLVVTTDKLSALAATTSAELAGVISDETGTGSLVFASSPSLTTPDIGAATATSVNGTTIPSSKTLVVTTDKLSALAATTSAELAGVISDETGSGSLVFATSPSLTTPNIGTPSAGTLTNCTGLPVGGVSGLGTGVGTALAVNTGSAGAFVVNGGALGTPSSGTLTNATGLPVSTGVSGLGTGVATALAVNTGSAGAVVVNGGALGTPSSGTLTNATGLPVSTGVSGLGTGVATALAVNTGSSGAVVVNGGALGTPSSGTVTNLTGTASININGTVGATTANTGAFTTVSASGVATFSAGTASDPAITTSGDTNNGIYFPAADNVAITTGGTQRLLVTSAGDVGIGGTPNNYGGQTCLTINNATGYSRVDLNIGGVKKSSIYGEGSSNMMFETAGTERMRIDSSGNVGIGTSSPGARLQSTGAAATASPTGGSSSGAGLYINNTDASYGMQFGVGSGGSGWIQQQRSDGSNTQYNLLLQPIGGEVIAGGTTDQGAYNLQCNGTAVWGAGAYVNGSDARIKEDVAPIQSGLDVVAKLNPVTFRYKQSWSKDQNIQPGFIAQELQAAMVDEVYVDGVVQQGPEYMSVAYQSLIPILTKAIQEQQQQIDALKAEVAALKGNA